MEQGLFSLPGLVIGLTVHEAAHAISAKWLGDRNAERMGRVSLNPFRHLAPVGTLALFLIGFGWGKPVMVNLYNFKRPKLYYLLSSLAGPASNILLVALGIGILYLHPNRQIAFVCDSIIGMNVILAVLNLLPIPPLDGSKIWPCIIPGLKPTSTGKLGQYWIIALAVLAFSNALSYILNPVFFLVQKLLPHVG